MPSSNSGRMATGGGVTLETERLALREPRVDDAEALCDYYARNAERFERFEPARSSDPADHARAIAAMRATDGRDARARQFLAYERRGANALAGIVTLDGFSASPRSAMIAYSIDARLEGRGFASEAVARVVAYAFDDLALERLSAFYDPANARSERLLARVGFTLGERTPVVAGLEHLMRSSAVATLRRAASAR